MEDTWWLIPLPKWLSSPRLSKLKLGLADLFGFHGHGLTPKWMVSFMKNLKKSTGRPGGALRTGAIAEARKPGHVVGFISSESQNISPH